MATAEDFEDGFREVPQTTKRTSLAGKCPFCPLGETDKRGVKCAITKYKTSREMFEERKYSCNLGGLGKGCIIPKVYQLAYRGSQTGRSGDDMASLHRTTF